MIHYLHRTLRDNRNPEFATITEDVLVLDDDLDIYFHGHFTGREDSPELQPRQISFTERVAVENGARPAGFEWRKLPTSVYQMITLCKTFDGYEPMSVQYRDKIAKYLAPIHCFIEKK